jgi:hypothetical protein
MQIHELTYKRRVDEASFGGAVGGAKAIAGAIGSQLASTASQKILGTDVTDNSTSQNMYSPGTDFDKSKAMSAPLIRNQAMANQKLWNQTLSQQMAAQGVTALNRLDASQIDAMKLNLDKQISKNFLQNRAGADYRKLPDMVDPKVRNDAVKAVQQMDSAVDQIMDFSSATKTPAQSLAEWTELTTAAFDAMRLLQFFPAQSRAAAPGGSATLSPKAAALAAAIGLDPADIGKLKYAITAAGEKINAAGTGSQSLDELLKAAKLL